MYFLTFWLSIPHFHQFSNISASASLLSLRNKCAGLTHLSPYSHYPWSISVSLSCLQWAFFIVFPLQVSVWIMHSTMLLGLRLFLLPNPSCLDLLFDVVELSTLSIWCICQLEVGNQSFWEYRKLYFGLNLLMGKMLDVARYGPHGGKLCLLCQGRYTWLICTMQYLSFDHHYIGNSNV